MNTYTLLTFILAMLLAGSGLTLIFVAAYLKPGSDEKNLALAKVGASLLIIGAPLTLPMLRFIASS